MYHFDRQKFMHLIKKKSEILIQYIINKNELKINKSDMQIN